ncbi:MAG TPA: SDR family oxidoreductase [Vicinamibacterales bacterium]|jgi:NAD(P)-dependent dehydrogenase (short-subunit alcohol dehydrogenase family)|nr:SDR family oxidoreductase [Vicinamibacterales bacterium]
MELGLRDRVAVVTGASKGIGRAIAEALAAEGVHLVLLARGADALDAVALETRRRCGVKTLPVPCDVRDAASVKAAVDLASREFPVVHILVNNAGGPIKRQERQITWSDAEWVDDVNTKTVGMLRVTQAVLPLMPRDGTGRVINVSGIAGISALGPALTHGINNAAMNQATSYLAKDLAAERITVNAVIPGLIATEWRETWAQTSAVQNGQNALAFLDETCRQWGIVSGRWGTMAEVADAVAFLASDRASYINGARLAVDGGYSVNAR